jgi:hypothetical protein
MAKQRPSLEAMINATTSQRHDVVAETPPPTIERRRPSQPHTSVYLSKPVVRELKLIAIQYDRKPHDILLEGVDLVLAKYGRPSISGLDGGK